MFHLLLYASMLCLCAGYYLTTTQKQYITNVLQHPDISAKEKIKVRQLLISKYSYWAIKQANVFRKKNKMRSNYVRNSELIQSCLLGLMKSMEHYDGSSSVPAYACKYIEGELYRTLTRSHVGGRFKHYDIMHKKKKATNYTQVQLYQKDTHPTISLKSNIGMKDREHKLFVMYIRDFLNTIRPVDRYIFLLRYDIFTGEIIRKHKDIGKLVCLKYKSVQKSISDTKKQFVLYDKLQTYSYKMYLD